MNQQEDRSKIDELNKSLYSRNVPNIRTKRRLNFQSQETDAKTDWDHPEDIRDEIELNRQYKDNSMSFFTKIFIASIIFFIISLGIGTYLVFEGSNIVSANNVDILIKGPVSVAGGDPVSFDIQVSNKNNIKLENINFSVDFPTGTTDPSDSLKELRNIKESIDNIDPGGISQKTIKAIIYGEENIKKEIKVSIEYRVKGSNALFRKEKIFDVLISSSPIGLSISSFKEVNSNQEFDLTVTMNSNSKEVIKNLLLKANYPFGFTYISSDLKPIGANSIWKIGDIPPGGKKVIKIRGKLEGQDDEMRVFKFTTGVQSPKDEKIISTEYIYNTQEVSIKKPFMSVGISLDGDTDAQDYTTTFNNPIRVDISYFNNLPSSIIDGEISVKLSGTAFDKVAVSPNQGLYKSTDNEIVWNSITTDALKNIPAGDSGTVSFTVTPRDLSSSKKLVTNPNIKLNVNIQGKRISETNVPENITSSAIRQVKISSVMSLSGQIVRSIGPFINTGTTPPKAENETTYTVIWTIDNTSSTLTNAQVNSSLPPNVKWLGKTSPSNEDIKYNSVNGQIVWNIGNVSTYTLGSSYRRQVAFQVSLNPDITQIDKIPTLLNQSTIEAVDDFTGQVLKNSLGILNTRFSADPTFRDGDEKVVK